MNVSTSAITNMRGSKLPYYKMGGKILFKREEINQWIETTRHQSNAEQFDHFLKQR